MLTVGMFGGILELTLLELAFATKGLDGPRICHRIHIQTHYYSYMLALQKNLIKILKKQQCVNPMPIKKFTIIMSHRNICFNGCQNTQFTTKKLCTESELDTKPKCYHPVQCDEIFQLVRLNLLGYMILKPRYQPLRPVLEIRMKLIKMEMFQ